MNNLIANIAVATRMYAIRRALDYDLRPHKVAHPDIEVPRSVWDAIMAAWRIAGGAAK